MLDRIATLVCAGGWLLYFAAALGIPEIHAQPGDPAFPRALALQIASIVFGVMVLSALVFTAEKPVWPAWSRWLMFGTGAAGIVILWQLNLRAPWPLALHALLLCAVGIPVGWWIGSNMQRVTHLVPLGIAMSMADIFSVAQGPSKDIAQRIGKFQDTVREAEEAVRSLPPEQAAQAAETIRQIKTPLASYLVAHLPIAGTAGTSAVLGIGDFVALAFIFRAMWVHKLNPWLVFGCAMGSTLVALALAQSTGIPIPALPVICFGTIGALLLVEPRMRRLDRQEIIASIGVFMLFAALIAARWFG